MHKLDATIPPCLNTHTHTLNVTNRHREGAECKDSRQARVMAEKQCMIRARRLSVGTGAGHTHTHTHFVRETMSQQPINPLWSIRGTARQKSLSPSLRIPRQYEDMFEARRLSATSIGEIVYNVSSKP